jgi:hypothetical protein
MFDHTSRYYHVADAKYLAEDGRQITYKRRRFLPQGELLATLQEVTVDVEDRLDLIAARTLGDPAMFWQVCDANNTMNPADLTAQVGRVLRVPVPQFPDQPAPPLVDEQP